MKIRRSVGSAVVLAIVAVGAAPCGAAESATTTASARSSIGRTHQPRLTAPRTTPAQDANYLADVGKADPDLATYVQQQGNVALKAMLTDGTAFCAFLDRGGGIDNALLDVAVGARSVESETHLPANVTTFNTIEAVALIVLCPSEQLRVPVSVRSKLNQLKKALGPSSL